MLVVSFKLVPIFKRLIIVYYENYDNINAETLNFELQYIDGNTYMYKLKSSDKVIMEIKIQVDNYPISKVIELLQKNIVFIK